MKAVEELFEDQKKELNNINVPDELETRLRAALDNKEIKKAKKHNWKLSAIAASLILMLALYNIDTLAYYGKKIIGYDNIMSGTLLELNNLGKGQVIDKSYTFSNGIVVTLDGIMLDDNQMLVFYTVKSPEGNIDKVDTTLSAFLKGSFSSCLMQGGYGQMNDEKTEMKWITEFAPPLFFEKTLRFEFAMRNEAVTEQGNIVFTLDRSKAMGHTLKKNINQEIKLQDTELKFKQITASPTKTVIKGSIQNIFQLAEDQLNGERLYPKTVNLKLLANGEELNNLGSGMSTGNNGITFENEFDALPGDLKKLQLKLESFSAEHEVHEQVALDESLSNKAVDVDGKEIVLNKLYKKDNNTYLTITTEDDIVLSRVKLVVDGNVTALKNTIDDNYEKTTEGKIYHTRTLCFPSTGDTYELDVQRITYTEEYNTIIDIPID